MNDNFNMMMQPDAYGTKVAIIKSDIPKWSAVLTELFDTIYTRGGTLPPSVAVLPHTPIPAFPGRRSFIATSGEAVRTVRARYIAA